MTLFTRRTRHRWTRGGIIAGVALLGVAIVPGAALATPPDDPIPPPDYSFDRGSPSVLHGFVRPSDVLYRGVTRARPALHMQALGLTPGDDIDALSGPNVDVQAPDVLGVLFSVDRQTVGVAEPDPLLVLMGLPYNVHDQAARGHAAGDQFIAIDPFRRDGPVERLAAEENNVLVRNNFDEGGTDFSAGPPTHASSVLGGNVPQDRVDAMGSLPRREDDGKIHRLYFSLTANSPSLGEFGGEPSGADIFFATAAPITGACCLPNSQCVEIPETVCAGEGGVWRGADSSCELCAIEIGACCLGDICDQRPRFLCVMDGGQFFEGAPCHEVDCIAQARGACCVHPGQCVDEVTREECDFAKGEFFPWTGCANTPCFEHVVGACCLADGCVAPVNDVICHGLDGIFFPGRQCKEIECALRGACCLPNMCVDGVRAQQCDNAGGVFHEGQRCQDVVCEIPLPQGVSEGEPSAAKGNSFPTIGRGTVEDPDDELAMSFPCDPAACCFVDAPCAVMDSVDCGAAGGVWIEGYEDCTICETPGACCLPSGNCVPARPAPCENGDGRWLGPGAGCGSCGGDAHQGEVRRFANYEMLGLVAADDVDAMIVFDDNQNGVFDGSDAVLFSLVRGSPSLATIPNASPIGAAADIFVVRPEAPPTLFAPARMLGLGAPPDNIDALNLVIEPEGEQDHGIRRCEPE